MKRALVLSLALIACSSQGPDVEDGLDAQTDVQVSADATMDSQAQDAGVDVVLPAICADQTCSGHGACVMSDGGAPQCKCKNGYVAVGLTCVVDPCINFPCTGRCQQCLVVNGAPTCGCEKGWASNKMGGCTPSPSPCSPNPCSPTQVCVAEIHCQPSGACLPGCDCSNCGNCSNISTNTNCGGTSDGGKPAVACKTPCSAGNGCIPTGGSPWGMCYPGEGCFSK